MPASVSAAAGPAPAVNWPKFQMDLANSGYNPSETQIGTSNVSALVSAWADHVGTVRGSPALWSGRIFVAGTTSQIPIATIVSAIKAATGTVLWTHKIPHAATLAGVTYNAGSLYLGTDDSVVHKLDARTGSELWNTPVVGIPGYAVVAAGTVYTATDTGYVYALNASTGAELWTTQFIGGPISGTPALVNGVLYEGGYNENVYAFSASDGHVIWSYTTGGSIDLPSPAVAGGIVYLASRDQYLYALDARGGTLIWKALLGPDIYNSPHSAAVAQGKVYASAEGSVQVFDAATGTPVWSKQIADNAGSPVIANGVVYVAGNLEGSFQALDASTGVELWSFTAGNAASDPIVANGMVFVGSLDGNLYAFRLP